MKYFCLFLLVSCLPFCGLAQTNLSKGQLEKQKKENLKKIQEANRILSQTKSSKAATVGELNALRQQIASRQKLISTINQELGLLQEDMSEMSIIIGSLQQDVTRLKQEYAAMVYAAHKADGYSRLMFLFSAQTFNQFLMRLNYMQQYAEARQEQVELINKVQSQLAEKHEALSTRRKEQEKLLQSQMEENTKLADARLRQDEIVAELSKKESEVTAQIEEARSL